MSLNKEIKELDAERLAEGEKSRAHYNALNLPGERVMTNKETADADAVRKRLAAMRKEREDAQQENPIK